MARKAVLDSGVLAAAMAGDRAAFSQIYVEHHSLVFAVCHRIVQNPAISEELTQDTFLQLLRKIHLFRGQSQFSTWLYQIARNTALMYVRDQKAKDTNDSLGYVEEDDTGSGQLERILKTDDHKLRTAADRVTLEKVIDKLAPGYRSMLVLHDVYGYEHSEICEIMGIRTGTSKSQVHKARKRLRLLLEAA